MADAQPKRTIGNKDKKIGGKAPAPAPQEEAAAAPAPKKGKKILVLAAAGLAVVGLGVGGATFFLGGDDSAHAEEVAAAPELGEVVTLEEPLSVNLAGGGYLRLGFALQMSLAAAEGGGGHGAGGMDTSRARDIAISIFSGRQKAEVDDPATREALRGEFLAKLQETFGADMVLDVYFTDFVTQ